MCRICPKCGRIAEFTKYYGRVVCTKCGWESEPISSKAAEERYSSYPNETPKIDKSKMILIK